jgi:hypothetical protein
MDGQLQADRQDRFERMCKEGGAMAAVLTAGIGRCVSAARRPLCTGLTLSYEERT